jgi:CHASE3 domain sensor protein
MRMAMAALNRKRLIGEVASRFGIRLDETDPAFVVVQLTQIALEESSQELIERVAVERREFEAAVQKVQNRAGRYVAQEFKEGAAALRRELEGDIASAGLRAVELVEKVHRVHTRSTLIRWLCVGILSGLSLFGVGVWVGAHFL